MKILRLFVFTFMLCIVWLLCVSVSNAQISTINMHPGSITASLANFYDSGGETGNYQNNEDITMTIYPSNPFEKICVTFHEFQTQSGTNSDILYVYDGNSTSAPLIAQLSGVNYGTLASSSADGSLTFHFISNASTNYFGWDASITVNNTPEDITMLGNSTWHVSSGRFYDGGGPNANYNDNTDATVTLFPKDSTDKLSVTFHEFQTQSGTSGDVLYVYDGNSTSAPLIAQLSGVNYGTITSSASDGSLTFHFISNSSTNYFGWDASISENITPEDITMLASGTYTVSSGRFYDNGGPQNNYGDNKNETVTMLPKNASDKVSVTFHECNISAGDVLYVYNGSSTSAPLIATISGSNYGTVTSTANDGALTFNFVSDGSTNNYGWYASISTSDTVTEDVTMLANGTFTVGSLGRFYDNGGPNYSYGNNQDVITTIKPEDVSAKLSVTFHSFNTQSGSDILYVYNGNDINAPSLGTFSGVLSVFTVTSTASDGSLTFKFVSNSSSNNYGWYASISYSSSIPSYNMTSDALYTIPSGTSAFFYDSGGPNADYSANENSVVTFNPANSNDKLSVSFNYFAEADDYGDYLEIHDGNNITSPLLTTLYLSTGYGTITASPTNTTGSLTFKFVSNSNGAVSGGWAAVISTNSTPQNISMPGTYTLPSGTTGFFYDAGGPGGDYSANTNTITTINPANSSDKLSVSFNYFAEADDYGDYLEIHDGNNITSPLLTTLYLSTGYGTITASPTNTTGSLTFKFVSNSNGAVSGGWAAVISTNSTPQNISMPGTYTLPSGTTGFFYDAGGPGGNYSANTNTITTINPANSNDKLSVSFNYFAEADDYGDYLEIHDGNNITSPLLTTLYLSTGYGTITASPTNTTGSLTFKFVSNSNGAVSGGWAAVISTNSTPQNISMPGTYTLPSGTTGFFYDAGGPGGNYSANTNTITTINPANSNDKLSISFNYLSTSEIADYLEIHDGNNITDPLIGTFSETTNLGTITSSATNGCLTFKFVSNNNGAVSGGWAAVISTIHDTTSVGVENDKTKIPTVFGLDQNYPNPFNPATTINYSVPKAALVTIKVYDILGKEVATLVNEQKTAGNYEVQFDANRLSSGVYFYRMQANPSAGLGQSFVQTKKLLLMK